MRRDDLVTALITHMAPWLSSKVNIVNSTGKVLGVVSTSNVNKLGTKPVAPPSNRIEEDDSMVGFGIQKVFDRKSIFYGLPSLNTIASYVEVVLDNWHMIPSSKDPTWMVRAKTLALTWRVIRGINFKNAKVMDRANLDEIDFGESVEVIGELLDNLLKPDEVFRPQNHIAFTPPYNMYRYQIGDGHLYWVQDRGSELTSKVLATKNVTKEDVTDMIWEGLGNVIQLEANDGEVAYVKTELTQKKIFGSSNDLIAQLKKDYKYFRENKLSRGYLLIGKPGTGKTGIVNSIVNSLNCRVFIISGFDTVSAVEEMDSLFVQMRPDFIIFDDCDRSNAGPTFIKVVLRMLENVKDKNPHTNFLFTANTFSGILYDEAVTRKGRIDQIYEVPEPSDEDRQEIFKNYAQEMGIKLSDVDMTKCIEASAGLTGADIKELCIQLQRATIDEVFERAREIDHLREKYAGENDDNLFGKVGRTSFIKAVALGLNKVR